MSKQNQINLKKQIAPYEKSNIKTSVKQLCNTIPPFILLWAVAYGSLQISYWLSLGYDNSFRVCRTYIYHIS